MAIQLWAAQARYVDDGSDPVIDAPIRLNGTDNQDYDFLGEASDDVPTGFKGLFVSSDKLGFVDKIDGTAKWGAYLDDGGNFYLNDASQNAHLAFVGTTGDLTLGDTTATNLFWDASEGNLSVRDGSAKLVFMDTDGLSIMSDVSSNPDAYNSINWINPTNDKNVAYIMARRLDSFATPPVTTNQFLVLRTNTPGETDSGPSFIQIAGPTSGTTETRINTFFGANESEIEITPTQIFHTVNGQRRGLFEPCNPALANSSWSGTQTLGAGVITTQNASSWGVPSEAIAIQVYARCAFSGANVYNYLKFMTTTSYTAIGAIFEPTSGQRRGTTAVIPLNASGQFRFQANANTATEIQIMVVGYYI